MDTASQIHCYLEERFSPSGRDVRLTGDTLLLEEKILDSVGMLELVFFIEETFEIEAPEDDIIPDNFNTINSLVAYVDRKRSKFAQ